MKKDASFAPEKKSVKEERGIERETAHSSSFFYMYISTKSSGCFFIATHSFRERGLGVVDKDKHISVQTVLVDTLV